MLTPNYNLETIQSHAFLMSLECADFVAFISGLNGDLTPQTLIDNFVQLDSRYQLLKSRLDAVQASLDAGHDPDRWLLC